MSKKPKINNTVRWLNIIALTFVAGLIIYAIEPWHAWQNPDYNYHGWNVFSYFTVQSNLIAAAVFFITAFALLKRKMLGNWFHYVRGGSVLYMLITGTVYTLLLEHNPQAHGALAFNWRNFVLHKFVPVFILAWWLIWPSRKAVSAKQAFYWLIFPVVWLTYTLVRGAIIGWYPYPFLDPKEVGGWGGVSLYILGILVAFIVFAQALAWVSRFRARDNSLF